MRPERPILIPRSLLLTADSEEELALKVALERLRGDESFWAPWIRVLPSVAELRESSVLYAERELLDEFEGTERL